jgi:hypothetical protein
MSCAGWAKLGRAMAWLTVMVIALATTAGALWFWRLMQGPEPVLELAEHYRLMLMVFSLLMIAPWWALLAVGFSRFNWLRDPQPSTSNVDASVSRRASSSAV